jgi:hypothetical protein
MPKAARERTVSFRARAPHSLRFREYPRPKASLDEQDLPMVTERGTDVKGYVAAMVTSLQVVIRGLDPRLSGLIFVDVAHGMDSCVF